jgi:MFS family permease
MQPGRATGRIAFYILLGGLFVSALGSWMTMFGLAVWAFQQTGSATAYSTLAFFATIPSAVGALFAGPYVDRCNRRQVMMWSDVIAGFSTVGLLALFYSGLLRQWHVYVALTLSGLASSFFMPAVQASVPMLLPQAQLGRASGLMQSIGALVPIISPPLAGALIANLGLGMLFVIDLGTFLLAILSLLIIHIPQPAGGNQAGGRSFLDDLAFGLRYVGERKPLVYLIGFITLFTLLNGVLAGLVGPLVLNFADAQAFGLVYAAFGFGALASGGLLSAWGGPRRRMAGILTGALVAGSGATVAGLRANVSIIAAGIFVFAAGFIFLSSLSHVIYQSKAAPEVLDRIFALNTVTTVGAQAGGVLSAGPLATHVFEPLLVEGGALAGSLGSLIGVGPGRGIGLIYVGVGIILLLLAFVAILTPPIRLLEDGLPDDLPGRPQPETKVPATLVP